MNLQEAFAVKMVKISEKIFLQNVLTLPKLGRHNVGSFQQPLPTQGKNMARLDVTKIIQDLGGATKIIQSLKAQGINGLTVKAVEKWRERGAIPMHRWLQLRQLSKKPLNLEDYLLSEKKTEKKK